MSVKNSNNCSMHLAITSTLLLLFGCSGEMPDDGLWGKGKDNLRIRIELNSKAIHEHSVQVALQNIGSRPMQIWESGFWPNIRLQCVDASGKSAETTVEGRNLLKAFSPGGSRTKNYLVLLLPKQIHYSDSVLLERVYELAPLNTYNVSVIYEETWVGGWTGSVTSNIIILKEE